MGHRRYLAAAAGLGAGVALSACGALLGIDDVAYSRGDGALLPADGPAPGDGPSSGETGADGGADGAALDGAPSATGCAARDAYICADFDEGDLHVARVHGVRVTMGADIRLPAVATLPGPGTSPPSCLQVATASLAAGGGSGRGQVTMALDEVHRSFHLSTRIRYVGGNAANGLGHVEFLRFYLSNPGTDAGDCTIGYGGDQQSTGITAHCPNDLAHKNGDFLALTLPAAPSDWTTFRADVTFGPPLTVAFDNGVSNKTTSYLYSPDGGSIEFFLGTVSDGPCDAMTVQYDDFVITVD